MGPTILRHSAIGARAPITVGGYAFQFVVTLSPTCDAAGSISEFSPQALYDKRDAYPLHRHGQGTFCRFRIDVPKNLAGVYALIVGEQVRYIGECADLGKRFNVGYGNISPKNCYVGGQSTNCKINRRVLDTSKAGGNVDLYFYATLERKMVERHILVIHSPPWNG